jgi:hypothetical protein
MAIESGHWEQQKQRRRWWLGPLWFAVGGFAAWAVIALLG